MVRVGVEVGIPRMVGKRRAQSEGRKYPDAACKPSPREPPVTTATLPSRENIFLKSWSATSASASDMVAGSAALIVDGVIQVCYLVELQ